MAAQELAADQVVIDAIPSEPMDPVDEMEPAGTDFDALAMPASDTTVATGAAADAAAQWAAPDGPLGPEGIDEHGHQGRIHTVVKDDTLWDISAAYLGTPWVWPSVWQDNDDIANPHLIVPGDHIWITAGEMRKVTRDEAEEMIAADNSDDMPPAEISDGLDSTEQSWAAQEDEMIADDVAIESLPVAVPLASAPGIETGATVRVVEREAMGFISSRELDAATSILDSTTARTWLAEGDTVSLGLGEGRVEVGDEFTIFRDAQAVRDLDDSRLLGYHVDILGWLVVRQVDGESARAEIRMSNAEIHRGDLMIPRVVVPVDVPIKVTPDGIDGQIVFMPGSRTAMGGGDHVYLNRGSLHGFEVGSEVEVFTPGRLTKDRATGQKVMTPDRLDAKMILVDVKPDTSVAFVVQAKRELSLGDRIRAAARQVARR